MNIKTITVTALFGLLLAAPAGAHPHTHDHGDADTPMCDNLDNRTNNVSINGDFTFEGDEIHIRDEESGAQMIISEDRELWYNGRKLELTPRGQEMVDEYYETFQAAIGDFRTLAGDAADLGIDAFTSVISGLFSGDFNEQEIESEIEAKAANIEASADAACTRLASLESIELAMAEEIDGFEPILFADK